MFAFSFKNGNNDPPKNYFKKYCIPSVEIKDFKGLIDNKPFFWSATKNKQEAYERLVEISKADDCTTGNLLIFHIIKITIDSLA